MRTTTSSGFYGLRTEQTVWTHGDGAGETLQLRISWSTLNIFTIMKSRGMGRLKHAARMG